MQEDCKNNSKKEKTSPPPKKKTQSKQTKQQLNTQHIKIKLDLFSFQKPCSKYFTLKVQLELFRVLVCIYKFPVVYKLSLRKTICELKFGDNSI